MMSSHKPPSEQGWRRHPNPLQWLLERHALTPEQARETLQWARQRADEIVRGLEPDSELLVLLRQPDVPLPTAVANRPRKTKIGMANRGRLLPHGVVFRPLRRAATEALVGARNDEPRAARGVPANSSGSGEDHPRKQPPLPSKPATRKHPRYDFREPVQIRHDRWEEFIEVYARDISHGGLFVRTDAPAPLSSRVDVRLVLPAAAGVVVLQGEVVHVIDAESARRTGQQPGFGIQFGTLSAERRERLERLVAHARAMMGQPAVRGPSLRTLGVGNTRSRTNLRLTMTESERHRLEQARTELAAMRGRRDREVFGLPAQFDPPALEAAYWARARLWHPAALEDAVPDELRRVAAEIFERLERARERLGRRFSHRPGMGPAVEGTRRATIVAIPEHAAEGSEGTNAAGAGASATVLCSSEEPPVGGSVGLRIGKGGASSARFNKLMGEGFDHLSFRRYEEAITAFRSALEVRPFSTKAKILLLFADARHLVKKGKLDEARTRYEDILQLDPTNVTAQRDLVMLNCL